MKHVVSHAGPYLLSVAPFAGAWIETRKRGGQVDYTAAAPFAGAWIETSCWA